MFKKIILPSMYIEIDGRVPNAAAFGTAWAIKHNSSNIKRFR
jgi:hypothetical protein